MMEHMPAELEVGFSPCPNDTFMFHAWVEGVVRVGQSGARARPWFADIEQLNERAVGPDPLPVTKISAAVLGSVLDRYCVATAGAALGRGVGPLVVTRPDGPESLEALAGLEVAIPGARTTASMLLRAFGPAGLRVQEMRFDHILEAVRSGRCDAGLIIHESRFTYEAAGLRRLADLGEVWEGATGLPLPLGVIAIRADQPAAADIAGAVRRSVQAAFEDPDRSAAFIRQHATEMDPEVCAQHIALYVNEYSVDVGSEGRRAVEELLRRSGEDAARLLWIGASDAGA